MGWGDCGDDNDGRPIGYNFPAACDHADNKIVIDNRLSAINDKDFMKIWDIMENNGYLYSKDNIEKVHLGWLLSKANNTKTCSSINRGLSYACGGMHGENETLGGDHDVDWNSLNISCDKYFCNDHMDHGPYYWTDDNDEEIEYYIDHPQLCHSCRNKFYKLVESDDELRISISKKDIL